MGPGTLYGALARLERRGLIEALEPEDRRRPYRLTGLGRGDGPSAARAPRSGFARTGLARLAASRRPEWRSREVDPATRPLTGPACGPSAERPPRTGLSRRQLMRRAVGASVGLWLRRGISAGTLGFLWSAAARATAKVRIGTFAGGDAANGGLPIAEGSRRTSRRRGRSS